MTVLSILPATAFAATGDGATITLDYTYDENGNTMCYNSSANVGGFVAGGAGEYKYCM